jgi:hypothetical protein
MGIACSTDPLLMCFVGGQEEALEGHSPDEATLEYDRGLAAEKVEDAQELYDHDTSYPTEECSLSDESTSRPGAEQPHFTEHAVSAAAASSEGADQLQHEIQPIAEEQEETVEQQQQQQQRPARVRKDLQIVTAPAQSSHEEDEPPSNLAALLAEAEVDAAIEQHMAALRAQSSASETTGAADTEQQEQGEDNNTADSPVSDEDATTAATAASAVNTAASSTSAGGASISSGHLPFIAGIAKLNLLQQQQQQQRHVSSDVIGEIATVDTPVDDDHGSKSFFNQSGKYSHALL